MGDAVSQRAGPSEAVSIAEERFDRWRRAAGAALAPAAFAVTYLLCGEMRPEGRSLSAILSAVGVLWLTETLPMPVTALLGAAMCIVLGVADARTVLAPFADPIVFLFIGSFILARAMMLHRLDQRIALGFLSWRWVASHPARVMAGLGAVTAFISMWVSNTATTAMMLPIALGVLHALNAARGGNPRDDRSLARWPYATGLMLMVAFSASIGGVATLVGTPPNLIGKGLIRDLAGYDFSFVGWMKLAMPIFLVMAAGLFVLLYLMHHPGREAVSSDLESYLRRQRQALGPWTVGQVNTLIAFGVAIVLWVLPGVLAAAMGPKHDAVKAIEQRLPESIVALIVALLLFVLPTSLRQPAPTIAWNEAVKIDWGTILLFGGGLSLGGLMFKTGVAQGIGDNLRALTGASSLWSLTFVATAMAIFLSETTSNTASANMVIPVVIALARSDGVNPVPPALGACLGASFGFMLPVSTPPNAIVYGSGLVPIPKMVRAGIVFDLLGLGIIWLGLRLLCPLLGLAS